MQFTQDRHGCWPHSFDHRRRREMLVTNDPCPVVIVDSNRLLLASLQQLIDAEAGFQVTHTFASGEAFFAEEEDFDQHLLVLCWELKDWRGSSFMQHLRTRHIQPRVLVYAGEQHGSAVQQAAKLGAWGYCAKSEPPELLISTLFSIAQGRMCFPYIDLNALHSDPLSQLTERELKLLAALSDGWSNQQIGNRFGISTNTVKYHLKNIYEKLQVRNRTMAVALYLSRQK